LDIYQLRAARAMLGLSQSELSQATEVSQETINKIESGANQNARKNTIDALKTFFVREGIDFIPNSGVRLVPTRYKVIEGKNCFLELLDDVFYELEAGEELLIACSDERVNSPIINDTYRRIRHKGILMRHLIEQGNSFMLGTESEYKCLPTKFFTNSIIVIYGDKVGNVSKDSDKVVIVKDSGLSESIRNLFNFAWLNGLKPSESSTAQDKF